MLLACVFILITHTHTETHRNTHKQTSSVLIVAKTNPNTIFETWITTRVTTSDPKNSVRPFESSFSEQATIPNRPAVHKVRRCPNGV